METAFTVIVEEFEEELETLSALISAAGDPASGRPRARVAAANAVLLLLAATFEEFIREMARAFARAVVESCASYEELPPKLASVAWKRTMEELARIHLNPKSETFSRESIFADAQTRFSVAYEFCRGDLSQDIYKDLVHNENNMRPQEINSLFKLSGLNNVCGRACHQEDIKGALGEVEAGKAHAEFLIRLEAFFERRNQVAHSLNLMRSSAPAEISADIDFLRAFGRSLSATLEQNVPTPAEVPGNLEQGPAAPSSLRSGILGWLTQKVGLNRRS